MATATRTAKVVRLACGLVFIGSVFACSSDQSVGPQLPVGSTLEITPSSGTIAITDSVRPADTLQFRAFIVTARGSPAAQRVLWSTSDTAVATIDTNGVLQARRPGTVTVEAYAGQKVKATVVITQRSATISVTPSTAITALAGDSAVTLSAKALDSAGVAVTGVRFVWSSSNPAVATVDSAGVVRFVGPGTANISVTAAGRTVTIPVTVLARAFAQLSAGNDAGCGLLPLGRAYCFGRGDLLGTATGTTVCFPPTAEGLVPLACALTPVRSAPSLALSQVVVGGTVACGIAAGRGYCWGQDTVGQLGNGSITSVASITPTPIAGSLTVTQIATGFQHACAIATGGVAYCWGQDASGQLGDNRQIKSTSPIPVSGGLTLAAITAGSAHTCALTSGGAAYCWGDNSLGQLGNGSTSSTDVPVAVTGGLTFASITAGAQHTCALTSGGTAYCWGSAEGGRLGTGATTGTVTSPGAVAGGIAFKSLSAGAGHTCGLDAGGLAYCWGFNTFAQIGNGLGEPAGSGPPVPVPTAVSGGLTFTSITAGARTTCAMGTNTSAYCWGSNIYGALGDGNQAAVRATPQKVTTP